MFPRTEFLITREPASGVVLGISGAGDYLPPSREEAALEPDAPLADSEILTGSLATLRADLASHSRRSAPSGH